MGNRKVYQFDQPIYPYKLWVVITDVFSIIKDEFVEDDLSEMVFVGEEGKYEAMSCAVRAKEFPNKYGSVVLFYSRKFMTVKNIAHESVHAGKQFFKHIGADIRDDEPFEYIVGWIAECIEKVKLNKCG
jgi:hypothetical protein